MPAALNDALGALPSRLDIHGLPFQAVFTYAVYTLSYVVVKVGALGRWGLAPALVPRRRWWRGVPRVASPQRPPA